MCNVAFTFAPGIEQYVHVIRRIMCGNSMAAHAGGFHRELISADGGRGRRVHRQLNPVAFLLHRGSLPSPAHQALHQRDVDLGPLCHGWQRP